MIRAERRLYLVVPVALALILSLLYLTFRSLRDALMIFSGVLFARVGGVLGLWVMGLPFTISAGVGFVALAGASMLEGLVLVSAIRDRMAQRRAEARGDRAGALGSAPAGAHDRDRGGPGIRADDALDGHRRRGAAAAGDVVVFGMACDTFLTMLALPVLYLLFGKGPQTGAGIEEASRDGFDAAAHEFQL